MANFEDKVKSTVIVDGKQGINELGKLEMQANEYRAAIKGMRRDTQQYVQYSQKLKDVKKRIADMRQEIGLSGMTMRQLRSHARDLKRQMDATTTHGTKEWHRLNNEIKQVTGEISRQKMTARGMVGVWSRVGASVKSALSMFGPIALISTAIFKLISTVSEFKRENIELSESFADVQKNTELTRQEVDDLMEQLNKIDTRSTRKELLDLSVIAGKLGIRGVRDIEAFVSAADKINVALGEDLGDVNETMKQLGKLVNVFKVDQVYGIEDSLLKVGSAVNDLGRKSVAQEKNIVEFTRRMGGIAPVAKIGIQDIMGLGAAGDATGNSMEVMGTALSQVFTKMATKRSDWVQFARDTEGNKMSLQAFTDLINTDMNAAFLSILRGLKGNSAATTTFLESLGDMGLEGQRVTQVIISLASNVELIEEQQQHANKAFSEGTSILEEFDLKNQTVGANLSKIWKSFSSWFVNSGVVRSFEKLTGWMAEMVKIPVSEQLESQRIELNRLHFELKQGNTPFKRRKEIIEQLKEQYPNYLSDVDSDKVKNEELAKAIETVNKGLVDRIIIQKRDEAIGEFAQKVATVKDELITSKKALEDAMVKFSEANKLEVPEADDILEQFEKLKEFDPENSAFNKPGSMFIGDVEVFDKGGYMLTALRDYKSFLGQYENLNSELETLREDRNELFNELFGDKNSGMNNTGSDNTTNPTNNTTKTTTNETETGDTFKVVEAEIDAWYQQQLLQLKEQRLAKEITNEEYNEREQELLLANLVGMKAAMEQFGQDTTEIQQKIADQEYQILTDRVDRKQEAHDKEMELLEEKEEKLKQQQEEEDRIFEQKVQNWVNAGMAAAESAKSVQEAVGNVMNVVRNEIKARLAQAISTQITKALSTVPFPFNVAAAAAAGAGASALFDKLIPSFYHGNLDAPETNTGQRDAYGPLVGYAGGGMYHQQEGIIPAYTRQDPEVINAEAIIAAKAKGYSISSQSSSGSKNTSSVSLDAARFEAAVDRLGQYISVLQKHGIPAHFSRKSYEDARQDFYEMESNRQRGSMIEWDDLDPKLKKLILLT